MWTIEFSYLSGRNNQIDSIQEILSLAIDYYQKYLLSIIWAREI